ncbi:hypothetical protein [Paraburkholderia fungorum]|uniref:hypothetical protein n=1 Tax=Paraburkholderia fungorum TaxID=134537 RepID=UPI0038B82B08
MNRISKPAASRLDRQTATHGTGLSYQRHVAAPRALFATPPVDLQTLVIAEAIKRRAQAEIQGSELRDALYEMPGALERGNERGADISPRDPDDYI